jgi:energy-coupling factor transport system ATP-binding protein
VEKNRKLILKDIFYRYCPGSEKARNALENVNLEFSDDRCYIVTGNCGSGKTTLSLLIKGLITPTSGEVILEGNSIGLEEFRRSIGLIFQFPEEQLFNDTIEEEIGYGPHLRGVKMENGYVRKYMDMVGLSYDRFGKKSPFELSSGEQRRVAIASVIACEPSWYIFDEPTAGLDFNGRKRIIKIIEEIRKKGETVIIITQEIEEHINICDEIVALDSGKVKNRFDVKGFLESEELGDFELSLPYHTRILRILRSRGWSVPVSIFDPEKAARIIVNLKKEIREKKRRDN